MNANYLAIAEALNLNKEELVQFAKHSFETSFLIEDKKREAIKRVAAYLKADI
jgi:adenosine deaminase